MKRIIIVTLLFLCSISFAQEDMGWDAKFAIGLGYSPGWFIPDYKIINDKVSDFGVDKFSSSGLFASGISGYVSIGVVKNLRLGGMGLSGSVSHKNVKDGFSKEAEYSVSLGGFTIEYSIPFIKDVAVSVGTIIGAGKTSLQIYQNKGAFTWDGIWKEGTDPNEKTQNINRKISNSFFTIAPTLNIDIPFYRFFAFRIGGGYMFALGDNWEADNGQALNNVPAGINSNVAFIQAGIFIGYFNY